MVGVAGQSQLVSLPIESESEKKYWKLSQKDPLPKESESEK